MQTLPIVGVCDNPISTGRSIGTTAMLLCIALLQTRDAKLWGLFGDLSRVSGCATFPEATP
jgi:hypothetical protein